ncbi:sulfatase [Sphingobacterium sp. HJSM2_6]|uniref:sulfatase family protein n=1 Tax=Sphingobacterium sp. HJSM2_6 TaxID=3366264 RepID=UPI003BD86A21
MRAILLFLPFVFFTTGFAQQKKPNIVIIISDDHSYQTIGAYGSTIGNTPHIDRIAKEGVVFNKAYVTNSICGPSRASLLTGKYSHHNGFKDNETSNFNFNQDTFTKQLQKQGYQTAWIGKIHLGNKLQGFDYYSVLVGQGQYFNSDFISARSAGEEKKEREEGYVADVITDKALNWMQELNEEEPFCLIIGHKNTHRTWMPDPQDFGKNDDKVIPIPETFFDQYETRKAAAIQEMSIDKDMQMEYDLKMFSSWDSIRKQGPFNRFTDSQFQQYRAYYEPIYQELKSAPLQGKELAKWKYNRYMIDYLNTAESMDRNIGKVLDYLKANNLEENTLVVYLSDQGFYMGEHGWFDKRFMYEESFRTPMLMKMPGYIQKSTKIDQMVLNVDIAPTILELTGATVPKDLDGKSFLSLLKGKSKPIRKQLFYHYYENGEHAVSPHFGVSDGRYKLIRYYKRVDNWELFDLKSDPRELKNIYDEESQKHIVARMKKLLLKEIKSVGDVEALALVN